MIELVNVEHMSILVMLIFISKILTNLCIIIGMSHFIHERALNNSVLSGKEKEY